MLTQIRSGMQFRCSLQATARYSLRVFLFLTLVVVAACDKYTSAPVPGNGGNQRPAVASVRVTPEVPSLAIGETTSLSAEPRDVTGRVLTDRAIAWSSSDDAVAIVSSSGLVTAKRAGSVRIRASAEGKHGEVPITVVGSSVVAVIVTPAEPSLSPGAQITLLATAINAAGDTVRGRTTSWSTTSPAVATVSAEGRVTALLPGDARIFATIDGKFASAFVHVRAPTIARLEITPADTTIAMDAERQLVATAFDAQGRRVPTPYVQWTSSDPATVSISGDGRVTGIQPGMVEISAVVQGHVARTTLMVELFEWPADLVFLGPPESGAGPEQIHVRPLDGRNHSVIALPALEGNATIDDIAPSPDGSKVAFTVNTVHGDAIRMDIWVVNRDGTGLRRLTTDVNAWEEQPAWSPDGSRIAYRSTQGGGNDSDIWVMNADGSDQRSLTGGEYSAEMNEEWPAWSPDGKRIAYGALVRPTGHGELWMMNADGAGKQRLTSDPLAYDWEPAWSPDGTKLAFMRVASMNGADVTILTVAGPNAGQLTSIPLPGSQLSPSWSPDGRYLAFASNHSGRFDIYTIRPDGQGLKQRTTSVVQGSFEPGWLMRR